MNSGTQFKSTSLILVFLLLTSVFSILLVVAPSAVVAQGSDIIVQGQSSQYNSDLSGDPPWEWYSAGDYPPVMAANRVGFGAVVASGSVPTCRDGRWTLGEWDVLLDEAFQWMVPGENDVLWYQGYNVYNSISPAGTPQCDALASQLRSLGYNVTGDDTEPITSSLLADYDILVIPQFQLGAEGTGGNPDLLPDSDVQAIVNFVEGGGGLLIMEGSDFYAYQYYKVQNKILKALNMDMGFQSDTIEPNLYGFHTADVTTSLFGNDYQVRTGKTTINMYGTCSMAKFGRFVVLSISPLGKSGENGENLTYPVTISNRGDEDDTYSLEVTADDVEWEVLIKPSSVFVKGKENENTAILSIKIPDDAVPGDYTWATVTATSQADNTVSDSERAGAEIQEERKLENWTTASKLFPSIPDYGVTVAGAGENIYMTNTAEIFRYNATAGWWEEIVVPGQFMNGSALCWDGSNCIYALGGGSYSMVEDPLRRNYKFYRYDISTDSWTDAADTPWHQGPGDALTRVVGDSVYIYAFLGTTSNPSAPGHQVQFWRYNIADDNWDQHLATPLYGADDGASLAWPGEGDYIYAFSGAYHEGLPPNEERHFLRYSILGDNWVEMTPTPYNDDGGVDDGGSLAYPGSGDYIYALKGGNDPGGGFFPGDNFWRYSISGDSWEILDPIPAGVGDNNGRRLGVANGSIYCWRGCFRDGTLWVFTLPFSDVDVSISPDYISGMPGATLEYSVTVTNTGLENENYKLENVDVLGWTLGLSQSLLTNVHPGENRVVTLSVTIPGDAEYCTEDSITVTAISQVDNTVSDSDICIAHQDYFEKECMPDLGQHCENWCWAAAAANSIYWYSQHGYPELIDDPGDPTPNDNRYITDPLIPHAGCPSGGYYRLLAEIAADCGHVFCEPVSDNDYFYGLQKFISDQGAPLMVHEIIDPAWVPSDPNTIPLPVGEPGVVWQTPTFENYKKELGRCQDVLLWLDFEYEEIDHVVTGVAFFDDPGNSWILVSDPWTTGAPDHNNIFENKKYDNYLVVSEDPFVIFIPRLMQTATIPKMIYISPSVYLTGTATLELENMYKVSSEKDLKLYGGSKLVVKFYRYDNTTLQDEIVIDNIFPPETVKENENAPHPRGAEGFPWGTVQIARLVLTTDNTDEVLSTITSFTVTKDVLRNRYIEILVAWFGHPELQDAFRAEIIDILVQWFSAPS